MALRGKFPRPDIKPAPHLLWRPASVQAWIEAEAPASSGRGWLLNKAPCPAPLDAWLLRRLLACHDVNGELAGSPSRSARSPIAWPEAACGPPGLWDAYLDAMAEEDVGPLVEAWHPRTPTARPPIRNLGSTGPRQERPRPLPRRRLPRGPGPLVPRSVGGHPYPVDYLGSSALAVAAGAIGQSVNLEVKGTGPRRPELFVANVGKSGKTKSPALRFMVRPLRRSTWG
ncbi:MAG: DUF3987 domain-containing protein [Singulisphaera sp.]